MCNGLRQDFIGAGRGVQHFTEPSHRRWRRIDLASSLGPVADDASIYALTANGPFDVNTGGPDYGESALRLGRSLNLADYFTPCNQQESGDLDVNLGSGSMMILPDQTSGPTKLIIFAGKEGSIDLVDRTAMGGYTPTQVADNVACSDNMAQELWRVLASDISSCESRSVRAVDILS